MLLCPGPCALGKDGLPNPKGLKSNRAIAFRGLVFRVRV